GGRSLVERDGRGRVQVVRKPALEVLLRGAPDPGRAVGRRLYVDRPPPFWIRRRIGERVEDGLGRSVDAPFVDEDVLAGLGFAHARAVLRVGGAVAAGAAERGDRREERALHSRRWLRRAAELGELGEDHGELQRRRIPPGVDLAVPSEPEERLQQHLRLESRTERETRTDRGFL